MARRAPPQIAGQQHLELRRDEAHLGRELHRLLAEVGQRVRKRGVEDHDELRREQPDLRPAEADDVRPDARRDLAQADVERGGGVGQPRAVDVQEHPARVRVVRERGHLLDRVERAELGRLRDRDDPGLDDVLVADPRQPPLDELGGELAVGRGHRQQLDAGHRLRGAALVDVEVRALRADHALPRPQHRPQPDDVRRRPVEDREADRACAEVLAHPLGKPRRHGIGAVGDHVPGVRGGDRLQRLGERGRVVVGGEGSHQADQRNGEQLRVKQRVLLRK